MNLMDENDKVLFKCTLDEAKRYAKKHDLLLVNYEGQMKTKIHQMQLVSKQKQLEDISVDKKKKSKPQDEVKKFFLKDSISDHDLDVKAKKMAYFLSKSNRVRVVINGFKTDLKVSVLDKIKKKFTPHISFKQVNSSASSIKLFVVAENTFAEFYEQNLKKDGHHHEDDDDNEDENEDDLFEDDELEDLINKKIK